ncbi:MAG: T9SS type A sorting domain-containing protein, partial [Fidelibacterota bacterium]
APEAVAITQLGGEIQCTFSGAVNAESFNVLRYSTDGSILETLGPFTGVPFLLTGLPADQPSWLRVEAVNTIGTALSTDLLAVYPDSNRADALIVQGFDRESGTTNAHDTALRHGQALAVNGLTFDCATNEAVASGTVNLENYGLVDWILGEEGAGSSTLSLAEQEPVKAYLEAGGRLLISGSEIGYDLVSQGNAADQAFYTNYLKAQYISDAAGGHQGVYTLNGAGILADLSSFTFDNGSHGAYDVDWPDGILPVDGAELCATYSGVDENANGAAGIVYRGTFGSSNMEAALVYLAVGFEALYPEGTRNAVMNSILDYLEVVPIIPPGDSTLPAVRFGLTAIYPNPASTTPFVTFEFKSDSSTAVTLTIYTLLGQRLVHAELPPEDQLFLWNRRFPDHTPAPSGVYIVNLRQGDRTDSEIFTLLK